MRKAIALLIALIAAGCCVGCPGFSVQASCKRHLDGTVECGIEGHRHQP